jgi:predicted RNA-binding Zn-ribbon protein involved in translation (DUF1610 family)
MSQTPQWPGMVSGWLVSPLWPLAAGVLLALLTHHGSGPDIVDDVVWGILGLIGLAVLFKPLCFLLVRFSLLFHCSRESAYACPACGNDIHLTPHHCPSCGTRLVWGELPSPNRRTAKKWACR